MSNPPTNYTSFETELAAGEVRQRLDELKRVNQQMQTVATDETNTFANDFSAEFLIATAFAQINGSGDVPEQKVQVQYLAQNQRLLVPQGLGMLPMVNANHEATYSATVHDAYRRIGARTYQELYEFAVASGPFATKRTTAQAWEPQAQLDAPPLWTQPGYLSYDGEGVGALEAETVTRVFAMVSRMFRLNFDIRDIGALVGNNPNMRMEDDAWLSAQDAPPGRLQSKLKPYTMTCIAGLNYAGCGNFALGAWIRAFGVCCGVLPTRNTRLNREWMYTAAGITDATVEVVKNVHLKYQKSLHSLCMNLIAIFGLMHLNKNHTFITGDANMERVSDAYLNTLRTMVDQTVIDELKSNREVAVRTAVHPFGLGQTYAVALILGKFDALSSPLSLRVTVTPPLTQRLMIVQAAVGEWKQLPVGTVMEALFKVQIESIEAEITAIKQCPPAYSELHTLYGVEHFRQLSAQAKIDADSMMPVIFGYAQAFHTVGETSKDGLALAMSFSNVQRDYKAATTAYANLWNKYLDGIEEGGLDKFIKSAFSIGRTEER